MVGSSTLIGTSDSDMLHVSVLFDLRLNCNALCMSENIGSKSRTSKLTHLDKIDGDPIV